MSRVSPLGAYLARSNEVAADWPARGHRPANRCLVIADEETPWGYPLAFRRFAQYAFIRLPIAAFSAAVHWRRFDFCFAFG